MSTVRIDRERGRFEVLDEHGRVRDDCARFLTRLSVRGLSPCTVEAYAYDLVLIYRWLDAASLKLAALTTEEVHRFLSWEQGRASHPSSINRRLHTLRLLYRFVIDQELPGGTEQRGGRRRTRRDRELGLQRVPLPETRKLRVKTPRTLVEPLTIGQVRELLSSLRRYRDLCMAHVMLLCGLRSQEVLLLRLGDIDFDDRRLRVRGKGNKERVVPLPLLLVDLLQRYLACERPKPHGVEVDRAFVVLQGKRRGQQLTRAGLRRVFRTRRQRPALANANPHRLRHTFGADMARSGVRLPILQRLMGHSYAETTLRYVNLSMVDIATEFHRAVAKLQERYQDDEPRP